MCLVDVSQAYLRFADDVVLVARTKNDIRKMLNALAAQALRYGLKINFDKTMVLTWDHLASGCDSLQVGPSTVKILRETESEKCLGRKLCFNHHQEVELDHRIAAAWSSFHKHKAELCSKHYALESRLKLFETVVTPTALYGCSAWALTSRMGNTSKTTRRKMLRYVLRIHRKKAGPDPEDWVDYMRRSAKQVDELSAKFGLEDWIMTYRRRKWTFAGQTARRAHGRWTTKALAWKPHHGHGRSRGRPRTRYGDDCEKFAGGAWPEVAVNMDLWKDLGAGFACRAF